MLVHSLYNSLIVAAMTTVLSVVLGTGGAWLLYRYRFPAVRLVQTLVFIPMIIPEVIMGVSLLILFVVIQPGPRLRHHHHLPHHLLLPVRHGRRAGAAVRARSGARRGGDGSRRAAGAGLSQGAGAVSDAGDRLRRADVVHAVARRAHRHLLHRQRPARAPCRWRSSGVVKKGLDPTLNAISTVFILSTVLLVIATELLKRRNR